MTGEPLLTVTNLSKKYCGDFGRSLRYAVADSFREMAGASADPAGLRASEFWALKEISFSIGRGEALAIVGRNGAGKSTLLKILYGLLKPDSGEVRLAASMGALIELGTGLSPLLDARENIRLAAAINGLGREREKQLIEEAVDFAELGEAVHAPFQTYSSGMKARLAFSIVAMMRPDVLLLDEVLAVGDLAFQRKCVAFMQAYLSDGGSLVFVSHNGHQVQAVCDRAILLEAGRIAFSGTAIDTLNRMYEPGAGDAPVRSSAAPGDPVVIEGLLARAPGGGPPRTGEPAEIVLRYRAGKALDALSAVTIWSADGWVCITSVVNEEPRRLPAGSGELVCRIERLPLVSGRYLMTASIADPVTLHPLARLGGDGGGVPLTVAADPSLRSNLQMQRGQIVEMEADWR
ncbi:MAG TPA: ABC transporter ATP-binding protein [Allosphingosinicella sp.]